MSEPVITRLQAADFDEAMDFLNLVFSMAYRPHDFARMLPILYRPTEAQMACNRALRIQGRIRAVVGVFPMVWAVGDARLNVAGIGGVAVHPADRGQGYMRDLMARCMADIRKGGFALSYLGGTTPTLPAAWVRDGGNQPSGDPHGDQCARPARGRSTPDIRAAGSRRYGDDRPRSPIP